MGCMNLSNYLIVILLVIAITIFMGTSIIIGDVNKILKENPEKLPNFSQGSVNAYWLMNLIFGIIAIMFIIYISFRCFLFDSQGSSLGPSIGIAIMSIIIFGFFTALFIGNSIFLSKIKDTIKKDPLSLPTNPNTVNIFYIINIILSVLSIFGIFGAIGYLYLKLSPRGIAASTTKNAVNTASLSATKNAPKGITTSTAALTATSNQISKDMKTNINKLNNIVEEIEMKEIK